MTELIKILSDYQVKEDKAAKEVRRRPHSHQRCVYSVPGFGVAFTFLFLNFVRSRGQDAATKARH